MRCKTHSSDDSGGQISPGNRMHCKKKRNHPAKEIIVRLPGCLQAAGRFGLGVQSWFLSAAPAASPKIKNHWGGKSLGWEILGKSMNKSRIFGNSDFGEKSRFENKLVFFCKVF
jgi:hypothetical protein